MNAIGVQFGTNIDQNHCQQYITDLEWATQTFLDPRRYLRLRPDSDDDDFGLAQGIKSET